MVQVKSSLRDGKLNMQMKAQGRLSIVSAYFCAFSEEIFAKNGLYIWQPEDEHVTQSTR